MNLLDKNILYRYCKQAVFNNFKEASEKTNKINFRCNICKDSKVKKSKKRGWILDWKGKLWFKCFNCNITISANKWLKRYFPNYYTLYIHEILLHNKPIEENNKELVKPRINIKKVYSLFSDVDNEVLNDARKYCIRRRIPNDILKKWYVCLDGKYKNRIIIPFYNKEGKIYYWQGRAIYDDEPKYLNRDGSKEDIAYNLDFIDKTKPIIITEGVIDSLFINNSVSVLSVNWSDNIQNKLDQLESYYLLDDDDAGKKKSMELIEQNRQVFLWNKFKRNQNLPDKLKWDINDFILFKDIKDKINFDFFKPYFSHNFFDRVYLI
jgi:hypothetical protein